MIGRVVIILARALVEGRRYFITITMLRLAVFETRCMPRARTWRDKLFFLGKWRSRLRLQFSYLRAESVLTLG